MRGTESHRVIKYVQGEDIKEVGEAQAIYYADHLELQTKMHFKRILKFQTLVGHTYCNNSMLRQFRFTCSDLFRIAENFYLMEVLQVNSVCRRLYLHLRYYTVIQDHLL